MQLSSYISQSVVFVFVMCLKQIRRSTAATLDLPIACVFKSHLQASCPSSYPICLNFVWFKNHLWTSYINQHSQNKWFSKTQIWTISLTPDPHIPQIAYKWFLEFCGFKSFKPPPTPPRSFLKAHRVALLAPWLAWWIGRLCGTSGTRHIWRRSPAWRRRPRQLGMLSNGNIYMI